MTVIINNLFNSAHAAGLSSAIIGYGNSNPTVAITRNVEFTVSGTTYKGNYQKINNQLIYEITEPALSGGSASGVVDIEAYWGVDANGASAYVVTAFDQNNGSTTRYLSQPGGSDIQSSLTLPVKPLSQASGAQFTQLEHAVLLLNSSEVEDLSDCVDPSNNSTAIGIPTGATGAVCFWVPADGSSRAYVSTDVNPTANGSIGLFLNAGDAFNPGQSPASPSGDPATLSAAKFIAATGATGRFEVLFYRKNS
jgi:hypothetical protein